ncbi:interferon beta-like [Elgaria multicarinata webbii]|uniref:interferon beta-like n=1 Tax=Elgaria multicarinata webbii TaxID=159646 RepID=UPI002FCD42C9
MIPHLQDFTLQKRALSFISIMIAKGWLLHVGLTMLLFTEISTQGCNQLRSRLQKFNEGSLELFSRKMASTLPLQCMDDIVNVTHPPNEENFMKIGELQENNAIVAIREIFQEIRHIFNQNHTEMAWDENSISNFMNGLDQEIEKLGPCLSAGRYRFNIRRTVKRYFQRINDFLKVKVYSMCAWKIVQMKVEDCFVLTDRLIRRINTEGIYLLFNIILFKESNN